MSPSGSTKTSAGPSKPVFDSLPPATPRWPSVSSSLPSDEYFWTKLSVLSVTQRNPLRSMRRPCATLNRFSPHVRTTSPAGVMSTKNGFARRSTTICPSGVVETWDAASHSRPAGNFPHGALSQLLFVASGFGFSPGDWAFSGVINKRASTSARVMVCSPRDEEYTAGRWALGSGLWALGYGRLRALSGPKTETKDLRLTILQ